MATLSYLLTQHPDLFNNHFTGGTLFCGSKCRGAIIQRQIWNHMTGQIAIVTASKALSFGADEIITIEKLPRALELIVSGKAGKRLWLRLLLPQSTTTRKEEFALTA